MNTEHEDSFLKLEEMIMDAEAEDLFSFCELSKQCRFQLGKLLITREVCEAFVDTNALLRRYLTEDWGDLGQEDKEANATAIKSKQRILAKYVTEQGSIYIITEADRSRTTIMFCHEY